MKLYEICNELANFELVCDEDGVILNADELEKLQMEKKDKVKNIGLLVKNLNADLIALTEEKKVMSQRFDSRIKAIERDIEFYKEYLTKYLEGEKFESDDKSVVISYRPSERLVIDNIRQVLTDYIDFEPVPDKKRLKQAIKDGKDVFGCHLEESMNIQIK